MSDTDLKVCNTCHETKPLSEYNRNNATRDGHQYVCRECQKIQSRRWSRANKAHLAAYREANREHRLAYNREYYTKNATARAEYYWANRQRLMAANKARYEANKDEYAERSKQWARENADRVREYKREWAEANRDRLRPMLVANAAKRRALLLNAFVEKVHPLVVLERADGVCGICGEDVDPMEFHVDHIIPLARGGEHSYANVQPAHPFCNVSKGARLPEEMAA